MTDFNAFVQTDEFIAYRKKQVEQIGMYIESISRQMLNGSIASEAIASMNGAMAMARLLIELPEKLTKDEGILKNLKRQKQEDIAALSTFLVRRQMINE